MAQKKPEKEPTKKPGVMETVRKLYPLWDASKKTKEKLDKPAPRKK